MLIKSCSLVSLKRTAEANGYRLVATKGAGHRKPKFKPTLSDIKAIVDAHNAGLLSREDVIDLVTTYNFTNEQAIRLSISQGKVVYHVL